uniref:Uncharacterized protein n=1 Tax=Arion vulgaris TaxID=1028688 RepID=A0A0B6ZLP2_9EUPU
MGSPHQRHPKESHSKTYGKLAGTRWGEDANNTRQMCTVYVRPTLKYCTGANTTAAQTNLHTLDKI